MKLLEWLQNLKQHSRPIGALCGKKFDYESQPFGRYGFPRVLQFFDTRTVETFKVRNCGTYDFLFKTGLKTSRFGTIKRILAELNQQIYLKRQGH